MPLDLDPRCLIWSVGQEQARLGPLGAPLPSLAFGARTRPRGLRTQDRRQAENRDHNPETWALANREEGRSPRNLCFPGHNRERQGLSGQAALCLDVKRRDSAKPQFSSSVKWGSPTSSHTVERGGGGCGVQVIGAELPKHVRGSGRHVQDRPRDAPACPAPPGRQEGSGSKLKIHVSRFSSQRARGFRGSLEPRPSGHHTLTCPSGRASCSVLGRRGWVSVYPAVGGLPSSSAPAGYTTPSRCPPLSTPHTPAREFPVAPSSPAGPPMMSLTHAGGSRMIFTKAEAGLCSPHHPLPPATRLHRG